MTYYSPREHLTRLALALFCALCLIPACFAQTDQTDAATAPVADTGNIRPSPILTGAFGNVATFGSGDRTYTPKFEPVLLLPLGKRFLVETEYSMELPIERTDGSVGPAVFNHGFEYLQLDYAVANNLTLVGGRFVTPFGIYKERFDPQWVRNLQEVPLIFPINDNSSNGGMARGGLLLTPSVKLNYATYYSTSSTSTQFGADRATGGRTSLYFAGPRLEAGFSYSRKLDDAYNIYGGDLSWSPRRAPIDVRAEYITASQLGKGYWLETGYRFASVSRNSFLRKMQAVVRDEQYLAPRFLQTLNPDLPTDNTHRFTAGWNYWPADSVKIAAAYGRAWAAGESAGVWNIGVVYRFTLGKKE